MGFPLLPLAGRLHALQGFHQGVFTDEDVYYQPDVVSRYIILGYLDYDSANANIGTFHNWILRKPRQ